MKRIFLALALLIIAATSASAQSSFIIDNRTGSDILVANGSTGDTGIGMRNPVAQLDVLSSSSELALRVESNSGDQWYINSQGELVGSQGPAIRADSNVGSEEAFTDQEQLYLTSGRGSGSAYDIVLNPSADGRVNVSNNLNMLDNNVTNFFKPRCGNTLVVDGVNPDGTYQCVNVSSEIRVENLSETLEAGNVANQTIDMDDNLLDNVGRIKFQRNAAIEDSSEGTLTIEAFGAGDNDLFKVQDTTAGVTVFKLGEEEEGGFLRNPASGEDIIRFNQTGGSDVEIPNGYLEIFTDGSTSTQEGRLVLNDENITGVNSLNIADTGEGLTTGGNGEIVEEDTGFLRLNDPDNVRVSGGEFVIGNNAAQSGTLRLENNQWIAARNNAGSGDINMFRVYTDDEIQAGANLDMAQNNINEVDQIIGNNSLDLRPEADSDSIRLQSNDGTPILVAEGSSGTYPYQVRLPNGDLNISNSNSGTALNVNAANGNDVFTVDSSNERTVFGYSGGDRVEIFRRAADESVVQSQASELFLNSNYQGISFENSGVKDVEIEADGRFRVLNNNIDINGNNITNINELQDYYEPQCGEFRAVKGIHDNGTFICTDEILEEETEGLNESLDAGNWAGDNDIYMNQSQILEIGTGNTNFTNTGGLDLGGDIDMNELRLYNSVDNKEINFGGGRISFYGGLDIRDDARIVNDAELEFGTDLDYDLRMDSGTGNLVLRNGSDEILVADSNENLFIQNGYLDLQENDIRDVGAIQDGGGTDSLVLDESNNLRVPNGYLDMDNNQINDTSRLKNDGQLVLEGDSQNGGSGDLLLQTGGSDRIQVLNDGQVRIPNGDFNISQNAIQDPQRINFRNGANTGSIEEQTGDQLAIDSSGGVLRLQPSSVPEVSVESDSNFNENNIRNIRAIQDNSGTDSIILQENNSVVLPNGNLNMQQNNINEFFDANCALGEVVERVYRNGSYSCLDIDSTSGDASQDLSEVLLVGNKAGGTDINMTRQDITDLDKLRFDDNIEIGDQNTASTGANSLAIGKGASAAGDRSLAIGRDSNASDYESVVIGRGASDNQNHRAVAVGEDAQVTFSSGTAVGQGSTAFGSAAAFGHNAQATGIGSFANGWGTTASERNAIAIGRGATSSAEDAFALGINTVADAEGAIAIGAGMTSSQTNLTRIGRGEVEIPNGNLDVAANNITNIDQVSGNSGEAIESQDDINMSDNDINEANAVNFGGGPNGKRLVKSPGGDLCLGDECAG